MTFWINYVAALIRVAIWTLICSLAMQTVLAQSNGDVFDEIGEDTDRWIELQSKVAKENALWKSEKEVLANSIRVLESEKEALEKSLESNKLASSLYSNNETLVSGRIESQLEALDVVEKELIFYEENVKALVAKLPAPIKKDVEPLVLKLAAEVDDQPASVASRMQSLISILTMIDHFNNSLTLTHEIRRNEEGGSFDTRVLYWGLSMGFAADATASRAWLLSPGDDGWVWSDAHDKADAVMSLIDIYENDRKPGLVTLPSILR